ncbi:hypothetical protein HanIR_Chr15g0749101 [Helianthus annuus]|nr:hypothetical protein HanIR_Chr15g0749101 [Helianthus annuus]
MVVYSDKIFLTTVLMKFFRCQIRQYTIPPKLARDRLFLCLYKGSGVVTPCDTKEQVVDIFTNALGVEQFCVLRSKLGMRSI